MRKSVPCHLEGLSCGRPCGKPSACGRHTCARPCHQGDCAPAGERCQQRCCAAREGCGHPCGAPCHDGACPPNLPCRVQVQVTCQCGHVASARTCGERASEFARRQMSLLASHMSGGGNSGSSVDLAALNGKKSGAGGNKILECTEDCAKMERNRRLAVALQVENPADRLRPPKFSDFLRDWARRDPAFARSVHDRLAELVRTARESKQRCRSLSFECMNRDKRQFVHEYSDHFGVDTESFDAEPKRNVVATAHRDRVWLPTQSVVDAATGQRKLQGPSSVNGYDHYFKETNAKSRLIFVAFV